MRKSIIFVIALAASAVLAETASAKTRPMGNHSAGAVKGACAKAGGDFISDTSGGYRCDKANCDGKGGTCIVECTSGGKCSGTTPSRIAAEATLSQVLTNGGLVQTGRNPTPGNNILGGSGSFATQNPVAAGSPMTPPRPVAPPPPQIR